ncbi:hypothetical protein FRX31_002403 [Thalictrum thalictroides]|uniref:Uncharacterized protein n=1 Tax=Thalictrum thalictroides TaxID=46969 RepID=A0A7J6XEM1_THATH|nr:hypothetical protein FRX31_002403 [Thalictrum thalictroides]
MRTDWLTEMIRKLKELTTGWQHTCLPKYFKNETGFPQFLTPLFPLKTRKRGRGTMPMQGIQGVRNQEERNGKDEKGALVYHLNATSGIVELGRCKRPGRRKHK